MDTITAIHTRRTIRRYRDQAVPRRLAEEVVLDAAQAPTTPVSGERVFHVIAGRERVAQYGERAKAYARKNRPDAAGYAWADQPDFSVFHEAPLVIVISAPADNTQSLGDCTRAGQNLMLSAHARGLGTCWVGAPILWLGDDEVKREFGIRSDHAAFAAFTLGYPDGATTGRARELPRIVWIGEDA